MTCSIVQQAQLPVAAFWPVLACGSFLACFGSRCLRTSSLTGQRRRRRRPDHPAVFASTSWHHQKQVRSLYLGQTRQYCVQCINIHFLPLRNILCNRPPLTNTRCDCTAGMHGAVFFCFWAGRGEAKEKKIRAGQGVKSLVQGRVTVKLGALSGLGRAGKLFKFFWVRVIPVA